jgi:hypothetical protein
METVKQMFESTQEKFSQFTKSEDQDQAPGPKLPNQAQLKREAPYKPHEGLLAEETLVPGKDRIGGKDTAWPPRAEAPINKIMPDPAPLPVERTEPAEPKQSDAAPAFLQSDISRFPSLPSKAQLKREAPYKPHEGVLAEECLVPNKDKIGGKESNWSPLRAGDPDVLGPHVKPVLADGENSQQFRQPQFQQQKESSQPGFLATAASVFHNLVSGEPAPKLSDGYRPSVADLPPLSPLAPASNQK